MKEHDEIDELFKNGLEDFRPDASHLHYAPIAEVVAPKAAALAAKAGFWTKWGLPLFLGSTTAIGTTTAVLWNNKQEVSLKTALQQVHTATVEVARESANQQVQSQEPYYGSMSVDPEIQAAFISEFSENAGQTTWKAEVTQTRSSESSFLAESGQQQLFTNDSFKLPEQPKTVIAKFVGTNIEGAEALEGIPVFRKTGRRPNAGYLEKFAPVTHHLALLQKTDSTSLALTEVDSAVAVPLRIMLRPEPVWPTRELNFRAGLAYVPLQQESEVYTNQQDSIDPFLWGVYDMVKRPSTKNELLFSLNYQKQLRNKLEFGVGFSMNQGGWRAYDDFVIHYWIDNQDGTFTFYNDTTTVGEWDVSYRAVGLQLSMGYHFPLGEKLAFGVNGGITGSQVFVATDYRSYGSNAISSANNTRFALSLFALGEFTYQFGQFGLSAGFNLNGRSEYSRVFSANAFYNNVSFGLHTGIHYYLFDRR